MWSFMATRKSLEGLKYDEGQLAVHPTSKPWGLVVPLCIQASWESFLKKLPWGRGGSRGRRP